MVRSKGLTGLPSLAYKGVEAPTPPNLTISTRVPTTNDSKNFRIGDLWLNYSPGFPNVGTFSDLYLLIGLERNIARWVNVGPAGAGGILFGEGDVGGPVAPDAAGILFFPGGSNMNTEGFPASNQIFIHLNDVIRWPATNAAGTTGAIYLNGTSGAGGTLFMHAFLDNTFLGLDAGNLTMTGTNNVAIGNLAGNSFTGALDNTLVGADAGSSIVGGDENVGIGSSALLNLSSGAKNVAVGAGSMSVATTASNNVAMGDLSLIALQTGADNIAIGANAGNAYIGAESDNIILYDTGTVGDNNTIRIGTQGTQTRAFCAGITGVTVANETNVVIDSVTGQLGVGGSSGQAGDNAFLATFNTVTYIDGTGANATYFIGTASPGGAGTASLNEIYDDDNVFFPGDGLVGGTPASFTAPVDGIYQFNWYCYWRASSATTVTFNSIITSGTFPRTFTSILRNGTFTTDPDDIPKLSQLASIQMDAGDTITWSITAIFTGGAAHQINGDSAGPVTRSYIQGMRIA